MSGSRYDITGEEMESRTGNSELVRLIGGMCGVEGIIDREYRIMLSSEAMNKVG